MYRVICTFRDRQTGELYRVGEEYPRPGMTADADRLEELFTAKNRRGAPMIELAEEPGDKKPRKGRKKAEQ